MGGGGGTSVTKNYSDEEAKYREKIMAAADQTYMSTKDKIANSDYQGPAPIGPSSATLQGQDAYLRAAQQAQAANSDILKAQHTGLNAADLSNNPTYEKMLEASLRPYQAALTQNLQGIGSEAIKAGAYGGGRQGVAESLAVEKTGQAMGDTTAKIAANAYETGLNTMNKTLALSPQTLNALTTGGTMMSAVGAQQEAYAQAQEDYDASARLWETNREWAPLQNYANLIYGGGSSQATTSTPGASKGSKALSGAATGAALGSVIPGIGTAVGAVVGGMAGYLL